LEAPEKTLMFVQVVHQTDLDTTQILQDLETIVLRGVLHLEVVIFLEEAAHPLEGVLLGVGVHHREALLKEVAKI
ncbi:MAG: hypothetical protein ACPG4G_03130, partial [Flavobacteriaceae bacterium]